MTMYFADILNIRISTSCRIYAKKKRVFEFYRETLVFFNIKSNKQIVVNFWSVFIHFMSVPQEIL